MLHAAATAATKGVAAAIATDAFAADAIAVVVAKVAVPDMAVAACSVAVAIPNAAVVAAAVGAIIDVVAAAAVTFSAGHCRNFFLDSLHCRSLFLKCIFVCLTCAGCPCPPRSPSETPWTPARPPLRRR